jgi:hypothetical protein
MCDDRKQRLGWPVGHAPPTGLSDSTAWPVSALSRLRDSIGEWGSVVVVCFGYTSAIKSTRLKEVCTAPRAYGVELVNNWRRAATYVDRILRGANPGDLPVQFLTKFELVINLKIAKALGLTVPQSILLSADEVIE